MPTRYPHIFILKDKHDDVHYIINSVEEALRVRLSVLRERAESGYYYRTVEEITREYNSEVKQATKKAMGDFAGLSEEEAQELPAKLKEVYAARQAECGAKAEALKAEFAEEFWFPELLEKVLALPVEEALTFKSTSPYRGCREYNAISLLWNSRSDHEYEGSEMVYPSSIEG